ncbi:ubiquitin carboxyl-terminal hydrolase 3-like [Ruditapes philippinarum]|uniref:ubiquitin carboxyl-terminal hydrolase 3-like n=1 Tax=Ruditapes philippinarum TaxID=129788 RepID=UPI00295A718A|nr:ubiquitin carboxyl-terminal hydrolase 3-like [Ruditapes philippinarum]
MCRYVSGHALKHHESRTGHCVCMDADSFAVYCYTCDEFVTNDTKSGHVDLLRKNLQTIRSAQNQLRQKSQRRRSDSSQSESENDRKRQKKDDKLKKIRPKSSGLRNLGNTCFMSAVLQSLRYAGDITLLIELINYFYKHFSAFVEYIFSLICHTFALMEEFVHFKNTKLIVFVVYPADQGSGNDEDVLLVEELRKTLIAIWEGGKSAISPESLLHVIWKLVPRFRGYQQQDAHEFMRYLLDRLHTELLALLPYTATNNNSPFIGPKGKSTIVTAIFGGLLQSEVNCLICGVESKKHDPFLDLSLDIPVQYHNIKSSKGKENIDQPVCKLAECLTHFTEVEELEETELYMCTGCKKKQRSTKKFWIRRLPNVLCLHLKRFKWVTSFRQKLETYIEFPLTNLDMNKYILDMHETRGTSVGSNIYDLAAVIVHHGSGAGSGHYTAYVLNEGQWYHFNDSSVTACEQETVMRCKAYILFYIRREIRLPDYLNVSNGNGRAGSHSSSRS